MKKSLRLIILLLLCFPIFILADCAEVGYKKGFKGVVSNKNGIVFEEGFTIPYGTIIDIDIVSGGEYWFDWNGHASISAKMDDIKITNAEEYAKNLEKEFLKDAEKEEYYTIDETILRSGPANFYDVSGTIPKNKDINLYYIRELSGDWAYVEYDGIYGWTHFCSCGIMDDHIVTIGQKTNDIIVFYGEELTVTKNGYPTIDFDGNKSKKEKIDIPSGTTLKPIVELRCGHDEYYCFNYNDELYCAETGPVDYWDGDSVFVEYNKKETFDKDKTKLYSLPIFKNKYLTDVKLEKEENNVKYIWSDNNYVYGIDIDGKIYWTTDLELDEEINDTSNTNLDDQKIDDIPNENNVIEDTEEKVTPKMETKQILIFMSVFAVVVLIVIILLNRNKKPNQEKTDLVDDSSSDQEKENESKEEK